MRTMRDLFPITNLVANRRLASNNPEQEAGNYATWLRGRGYNPRIKVVRKSWKVTAEGLATTTFYPE